MQVKCPKCGGHLSNQEWITAELDNTIESSIINTTTIKCCEPDCDYESTR